MLVAAENGVKPPNVYDLADNSTLANLDPWYFVSDEGFDPLYTGLNVLYPIRWVVPFAHRADNDDVACFVIHDPEQVSGQIVVVHDFASPGWEIVARM